MDIAYTAAKQLVSEGVGVRVVSLPCWELFAAQDESDNEHAFVLHVMNADGSGIRQVSFNQSHDLDPAVLDDGRVVFSRWDRAPGHDEINLYAMRPDGTGLELLYGAHSHATGTNDSEVHFLDPRPMADGRLLVRVQPFEAPDLGGQLLTIDVANYVEDAQPTLPNRGTLTGPAQVPSTINDVRTIDGPSPGGRYLAGFPLRDGTGRLLLTWTQCRLLENTRIVPCTPDRLAAILAIAAFLVVSEHLIPQIIVRRGPQDEAQVERPVRPQG